MSARTDYARQQDQLVRSAQSMLLDVFHASGNRSDQFLIDGFSQCVSAHGELGAAMTADYLVSDFAERGERVRSSRIDSQAPSLEQVDGSARWALYDPAHEGFSGAVLNAMQGALIRLVLQASRDMILSTVGDMGKKTRTAMARVPEVGACDFCLMLSSRGAVYTSRESAGMDGSAYHDNCRCTAVVAYVDGSDLPKGMRELQRQWYDYAATADLYSPDDFGAFLRGE